MGNAKLHDLAGLEGVAKVTGNVVFQQNPKLTNFNDLHFLTSIEGGLAIIGNGFVEFDEEVSEGPDGELSVKQRAKGLYWVLRCLREVSGDFLVQHRGFTYTSLEDIRKQLADARNDPNWGPS